MATGARKSNGNNGVHQGDALELLLEEEEGLNDHIEENVLDEN
ncbi:hypothetical protein TIFTF001_039095 [Ficus carica]|uniref:Uncharacterized protein n=1 Tax=Ficus carica TaxID=3494 RepID=A0AA88JAN4_FICCA|nr:hypothetical protein TIFTF001_037785 [Ficus carica]GMN68736.1 hypothetical protein TIFTF001_037787 [Ficus carica]GMN70046.1 hypothetical protein TIFTF001_039093 [Ficus carica]GMN70053.1 hypothetical protein TIFTF001_039095 [Ficus carica]